MAISLDSSAREDAETIELDKVRLSASENTDTRERMIAGVK